LKSYPKLLGLHARPEGLFKIVVGLIPLMVLVSLYFYTSHMRLQINSDDKLTPSISSIYEAVKKVTVIPDPRTGQYTLLNDTISSLKRILIGLSLAALVGLFLGVNMGLFPGFNAIMEPVIKFFSIVPPLSILPVLFILFGVGEFGKIALIFIGSTFLITRDIYRATKELPEEQICKALTLGATQFQVVYMIIMPQILPKLLSTLRICLGGAWLFLIASEAIASVDGLGYRIFLVRRYLSMDLIIPYVLWITFLGFMMDTGLRLAIKKFFPWYLTEKD
jgi:NitT/TauT family transport system permease protein